MKFKTFEEIHAWQDARLLASKIRIICLRKPAKNDWTWCDQISRSALSSMATIAEGNDAQSDPEFIVFLGYAKRSAAETRSHLYCGLDRRYLSQAEFEELSALAKKIASQIAALIKYLRDNTRGIRSSPPHPA